MYVNFQKDKVFAAVAVFQFSNVELIEETSAGVLLSFPYIPGRLSFRESPEILAVLEKLAGLPDMLDVDGHGLTPPRRYGITCHLGMLLYLPAIGCAKSS